MGATGIHDHPTRKLGLVETDPSKPILELDGVLTDLTLPSSEDRYAGVKFGLDGNDQFGDCGPTSVDNNRRSTSYVATGKQRTAPLPAVYDLYRASGNPNFDPAQQGTEDNGVEMGAMLDALMKVGLDGDKPVAFGRVKDMSDATIERLVATFGGVLFAVTLDESQQAQSDGSSPLWDFKQSPVWGGHAIFNGKYRVLSTGVDAPVISWQKEIGTTDSFRKRQLDEVWVIIWPWHLEHPAFLAGVDQTRLAEAFKDLTGKVLPLAPPTPTPTAAADVALWTAVQPWSEARHVGSNRRAAEAVKAWAAAQGL